MTIVGNWGRTPTLIGQDQIGVNYIIGTDSGGAPPAGRTFDVRITFNGNDISTTGSTSAAGGMQKKIVRANAQGRAVVFFTAQTTGTTTLSAAFREGTGNWAVDSVTKSVEVQTGVPSQ